MKTKGIRLYGKNDLRLEEFELPAIKDDEILAKVYADSLCMSTLKAAKLGAEHKRIPDDVAQNPILIGHEFSGEIVEIGKKWQSQFEVGQKFSLQPALNYKGSMDSPGYSYKYCGGDATYIIIPNEVMEVNCLIPFYGDSYFSAALSEPYSCVIGACHSLYRSDRDSHNHHMGMKKDGYFGILGGCGPMGLALIDYAIVTDKHPKKIIVTDMDDYRLSRAEMIFGKKAKDRGIDLVFFNPKSNPDSRAFFEKETDGQWFDDIMVMVASTALLEEAESYLAFNGCLNFFAGPTDNKFSAKINYYDIHYLEKHIIGTTGGNADDQREALALMDKNLITPEALITHVGGIDAVIDSVLNLDKLLGGKKLIYTHVNMELTAVADMPSKKSESPFWEKLGTIIENNNGLWCKAAEDLVMSLAENK